MKGGVFLQAIPYVSPLEFRKFKNTTGSYDNINRKKAAAIIIDFDKMNFKNSPF